MRTKSSWADLMDPITSGCKSRWISIESTTCWVRYEISAKMYLW